MFKRFLFLTLMMLATCICEIAYASGIMISGAMDVETEYMINALQNRQEHRLGVWRFVTGEYQGCPMIISVTSVSQANAAASTALGIEKFQPVAIINQGTAGAHAPEIHPFDIVIGTSACDFGAYKTDSKGNPTFRGVKVYDESSGDFIRVVDFQPDQKLLRLTNLETLSREKSARVVLGINKNRESNTSTKISIRCAKKWKQQLSRKSVTTIKFHSSESE